MPVTAGWRILVRHCGFYPASVERDFYCRWFIADICVRRHDPSAYIPHRYGIRSGKVNKSYFVDSFKEIDWRCLVPILIGISVVIGTHIIGLFLSLTVMLFCWLKFLSGYRVAKSLTITVCVMAVLYGIFKAWLIVPLPKGLLNFI